MTLYYSLASTWAATLTVYAMRTQSAYTIDHLPAVWHTPWEHYSSAPSSRCTDTTRSSHLLHGMAVTRVTLSSPLTSYEPRRQHIGTVHSAHALPKKSEFILTTFHSCSHNRHAGYIPWPLQLPVFLHEFLWVLMERGSRLIQGWH